MKKSIAVSLSSGFYKGSSALALAYARKFGPVYLTSAISKSAADTASRASVNWSW